MTSMSQRPIRVLHVGHDSNYSDELATALEDVDGANLEVESVGELSAALQRLSEGGVDVVLLGLDLPDSQGTVTFERTYAFAPDVPIVVLTEEPNERVAVATVQGGAQDCLIPSQVEPREVARALRYAIERHRLLSALRSLSLIDDLTGLYNRRGFADLGEQYLKLSRRSTAGGTLVFLDLDRFKTINHTLGHHVGDRALLKMSDILKSTFRRSDLIARVGGDEFAVLALESTEENAAGLVDRVREKIEEFNEQGRELFRLSASVGMARFEPDGQVRLEDLLTTADEAMTEEKNKRKAAVR